MEKNSTTIRYVAVGDSYTIGEGLPRSDNWPSLITEHLQADGIDIQLIANPSKTGWTTRDLIDYELPVVQKEQPQLVTVLIGVNDWVQRVDAVTFQKNIVYIFDYLLTEVESKPSIVTITIPDFSATPQGSRYGGGRDISAGINEFNKILIQESQVRSIPVVDIFELSKGMKFDETLVHTDGLHPSKKEYELWKTEIYPAVKQTLESRSNATKN